jgi:DNA-binding PadR family transcriptional regulator
MNIQLLSIPMRGKSNPFPSSEFALLGLLYQGPCHGYELHKKISEINGLGMIWGVKMSNLYAQLDKLEQNGQISSELLANDPHPNRKQYQLTEAGKAALISWLEKPIEHPRDFRQEFMVRYYFLNQFSPEKVNSYLQKQIEECQNWVRNIQDKALLKTRKGTFEYAVLQFRLSQTESMLEWLKWLSKNPIKIQSEEYK